MTLIDRGMLREVLGRGVAIPACPLALDERRRWDARSQRALIRYYVAAGAGGIALGVHTTQFAIRDAAFQLYEPLLDLVCGELDRLDVGRPTAVLRIGGVCGSTLAAVAEAELLQKWGFHVALVSLSALPDADEHRLVDHCRAVADVIPIMGFYLQPAVGGRVLPRSFWSRLAEIENVVAIKIAPFNRYQTIDVVRAVAESGRGDIALYTGNDDHIILDLVTPHRFRINGNLVQRRIVGGLLGQWAVWTRTAVELFTACRRIANANSDVPADMLRLAVEWTDANSAIFDAAHDFAGCIAGIHEILRRQGLMRTNLCLDPKQGLSPNQVEEIDRVCKAYPHLADDDFIRENLDAWLEA